MKPLFKKSLLLLSIVVFAGAFFAYVAKPGKTADPKLDKLKLQPGFEAQHLYSPSENEQGSWVSMCFDNKGRLITSDQYGKLYISTFSPIGTELKVDVKPLEITAEEPMGTAHGLLYAFNSLYVMVNNRVSEDLPQHSGLYRLQDTNGDDSYDKVTLLKELEGHGEHGPHSILLSPDGKSLHVISGNYTKEPGLDTYRLPKTWEFDNLFPLIKDPRGHANHLIPPGGWVATLNPDGSEWELVSSGYRNPFDMTFNDVGDLFVYDADMEWDFGTPWYRPTRICHATSGSEFGWRTGNSKWSPAYPDNVPPVINIGQGSPTNLVYLKDAKFPAKYTQSILAFDWSFGIMHALHLEPEGASYKATREEFLSGIPLPLTDGVVGPDGALYFMTGGRRIASDVYRVFYTGGEPLISKSSMTKITLEGQLRRKLETYHSGGASAEGLSMAWDNLNHKDRFIRYASRLVLEHQPLANWEDKVLAETNAVKLIQAALSYTRMDGITQADEVVSQLVQIPYQSLSESEKIDLIRTFEVFISRNEGLSPISKSRIIAYLNPNYPGIDAEENRSMSKVLIYLQAPGAVAKTVDLLVNDKSERVMPGGDVATSSADLILRNPQYGMDIAETLGKTPPTQQTYLAIVLSEANYGWTPKLREQYFAWYKKAFEFRGGRSYIGFVNKARERALDFLSESDRAKYDHSSGGEMLSDNGNDLTDKDYPKGPGKRWNLEEASALFADPLVSRDFNRGRSMFKATTCSRCHAMAGEGNNIGPDLTRLGTRFTKEGILEAIIHPSKAVSDQYAAIQYDLKSGESIVGSQIEEKNGVYIVSQNPYAPEYTIEIKKSDVVSKKYSEISLMLPGLINSLNAEELKDLMAYLVAGGNPKNEVFAKN